MDIVLEFLLEYLKLCLKYNLQLSACGCCNSPYLIHAKKTDFIIFYKIADVENIYIDFDNKCIIYDMDGASYQMNLNCEVKEIKRW